MSSPASRLLLRHSDSPSSRLPGLRCLRPGIPPMRSVVRSRQDRAPLPPGRGCFLSRLPQPVIFGGKRWDLPSSWGTPMPHAPLSDPGGTLKPGHLRLSDAAFRYLDGVGFHNSVISGLYHAACHAPCLRFAARVTPAPRKTRFRLLASFAGGDWLLPGSLCEVSVLMSYLPPRPSFAWRTYITKKAVPLPCLSAAS